MIWLQRAKLAKRIEAASAIREVREGQTGPSPFQVILDTILTLEEFGLLGDDIE